MNADRCILFNKLRLTNVILAVLLRIVLDVSYYSVIAPIYDYTGLVSEPAMFGEIVLSYILVILTAIAIPLNFDRFSSFAVSFLYVVSYIPTTSLYALASFPIVPMLWLTSVFLFLFFLVNTRLCLFLPIKMPNSKWPVVVTIGLLFSSIIILVIKYGIKVPSFTFTHELYNLREEYDLGSKGLFEGYLTGWLGDIVIPFVIGWSLIKRKYLIFIASVASQIELFAIASSKSHLFSILLILWYAIMLVKVKKNLFHMLLVSMIIFFVIIFVLDIYLNSYMLDALFTRRMFFIPSQLYYYYYDFFSKNPHTFLSETNIFRYFLNYPYDLPVAKLIGYYYVDSIEANANANMWASAYASLGILGMFLFSFMLWVILLLIDRISSGKNIYYAYLLMAVPLFSLTNGSLLTNMLTNGMILSIILIYLLPRQQYVPYKGCGPKLCI